MNMPRNIARAAVKSLPTTIGSVTLSVLTLMHSLQADATLPFDTLATEGRTASRPSLRGVLFANGQYIAVGEAGTILTSSNRTSWIQRYSGVDGRLSAVAFGAGRFVAVGDHGTIVTSVDGIR